MNYPNVKLVMKSVDANNNTISTTIGYANPNASDDILKEFAEKLNAFTTNTFMSVTKVTTDDITFAEGEVTPEVDTNTYTYELSAQTQIFNIDEANSKVTLTMTTTAPQGTGEWDLSPSGDMDIDSDQRSGNTITMGVSFDNFTRRTETLKVQLTDSSNKLTNFVQFVFKIS